MSSRQQQQQQPQPQYEAHPESAHGHGGGAEGGMHPVLASLERMLGLEGRTWTTPDLGIQRFPPREIPVVYLIVLGVLTLLFGWKALVIVLVLYVLSQSVQPS